MNFIVQPNVKLSHPDRVSELLVAIGCRSIVVEN